MPSGIPLDQGAANLHADVADTLELILAGLKFHELEKKVAKKTAAGIYANCSQLDSAQFDKIIAWVNLYCD